MQVDSESTLLCALRQTRSCSKHNASTLLYMAPIYRTRSRPPMVSSPALELYCATSSTNPKLCPT